MWSYLGRLPSCCARRSSGSKSDSHCAKKKRKEEKKKDLSQNLSGGCDCKSDSFSRTAQPTVPLSLSLSLRSLPACLRACVRACGVFALAEAGKSSQLTHLAGCSSLCRCARTALILLTLLSISSFFSSNLCLGSFVCLRALRLACLHRQEALRPHAR